MTPSPWSRQAPPTSSVTVPPPIPTFAPPPQPQPVGANTARVRRRWPWAVAVVVAVGLSAGAGSAITYMATRSDHEASPPSAPASAPTSKSPAPQLTAAEVATARQNVCHVFETSVGHTGQGGFRVEGKVNVPVTLQSVTSAIAVEHALTPAVPADVSAAAHRYVDATLDVTTATMGGTPTSEVARLTDVSNEAIYALADLCGVPR